MCVQKSHEQDEQEDDDLCECRHHYFPDCYGQGIHEDELYIEDEEDQCIKVITDIELIPGGPGGGDTAFIGLSFLRVLFPFYEESGSGDPAYCKGDPGEEK